MRYRLFLAAVLALSGWAAAAQESGSRFGLPVDCEMGTVCFIQNYVDRDPGALARDHACGLLSYDGYKGTDFRVADLVTMRRGIAVIAAAAGTVRGMRDEMPDTGFAGAAIPRSRAASAATASSSTTAAAGSASTVTYARGASS